LVKESRICVSTDLWDVVISPLSLLFLQLNGDSSDWSSLDTLHQMGYETATAEQIDRGCWSTLKTTDQVRL